MDTPRPLHFGIAALLFVGVLFIVFSTSRESKPAAHVSSAAASHIPEPEVLADAAIVFDVRDQKILFQKNATAQLPLASITKVMTVIAASSVLDLDETVTIPAQALIREGESGFTAGSPWILKDLIDFTLITSSNDGAQALALLSEPRIRAVYPRAPAENAFLWLMNEKAREFNLTHTFFLDPTGLDESPTMASAYGSAFDIAQLIAKAGLVYGDWFSGSIEDGLLIIPDEDAAVFTANNTNKALSGISGLIAGKTGFTDLAGGNLAILFDADINHPIAIVVLHSTRDARFVDVKTLVDWTRTYADARLQNTE